MKKITILAVAVLSLAILAGPAAAQQPAEVERVGDLEREAARIGRSLEQVGAALEALVQLQRTNLLLHRLEIEERRISPLAGELRSAKANSRHQEEELTRIQGYREELERRVAESTRTGQEPDVNDQEQLRQVDKEVELQTETLEATYRRIQELENDLARARRTLEVLEEIVAEAMDELDRKP